MQGHDLRVAMRLLPSLLVNLRGNEQAAQILHNAVEGFADEGP